MKNFTSFPDNTEEKHEIAGLARQVGGECFDDMETELDDLVTSHAEELTEKKEEEVGNDE